MRLVMVLLLVGCIAGVQSQASMAFWTRLTIDFTDAKDAEAKASWFEPDKLTLTASGLGLDGDAASSRDGWIQTKPFAVGLSWRPTAAVQMHVQILPPVKLITLTNGQTTTAWVGQVFARYSPDCKHWSSWQALSRDDKKPETRVFTGELWVPNRERETYCALLSEYAKLDVPWKSDEEAAVTWILQRTPDFFEHSLPFIGYVEFLFEAPFYGGQHIQRLEADLSYGMGGLHQPPKDQNMYREREQIPWRFRAH
jgi:hypothetical protein